MPDAPQTQIRPDATSDRPASPAGLSITDFLTDGSLIGLCQELSRLAGVEVRLRDAQGRRVVRSREGGRAWRVLEDPPPEPADELVIPIALGAQVIGSLCIDAAAARDPGPTPEHPGLEQTLRHLASAVGELCQHESDLRHRVKELDAVYRLTSLLVRVTDADTILRLTLDLALEALELDAGSVVMLPEDADGVTTDNEEDLVLKASVNLSRAWLECPMPLSRHRLFDRLALNGEVVVSPDIASDDRVLIADRAAAEGLAAAINAGLIYQGKRLGVIRLYSRRPRQFSDAERRLLRSLAQQAAVAVEQARLTRLEAEDARLQRQLELAADVQRRMLPRSVPASPGLDAAARYLPSAELGGDFYDFIELGGHLGIAVGDVVGKGIAAALLMSAVRASLRAFAQDVYDLDEVLSRVNQAVCRDTRDDEFATIWYGVIDPRTLRLTYCSAGHDPPLIVRATPGTDPSHTRIDELGVGGMAVGIDPAQRYERGMYDLRPGDVLLAFTDGLPDAMSFSGEKFGRARIRNAVLAFLAANPGAGPAQILDHLFWEIRRFTGLAYRPDDQTAVALRVRSDRP